VDNDGMVFIPPAQFKLALAEAARYKSVQIPGKGKATYTKHFEAGVLCAKPLPLMVHIDKIEPFRVFVPADGKRGGGKRVWKHFPHVQQWAGTVEFMILDDIINNEVFETHLVDAGQFVGIGFFRPRNNGYWGRFMVKGVKYKCV
jgi:hypothetical protein